MKLVFISALMLTTNLAYSAADLGLATNVSESLSNPEIEVYSREGGKFLRVRPGVSHTKYSVKDDGKTVKAEDGTYYAKAGRLDAYDSRLRTAVKRNGSWELATYQLRNGWVLRATKCKRNLLVDNSNSYDCYYASDETCKVVNFNLHKYNKDIPKCLELSKNLMKILPYNNKDYREYANREVIRIEQFVSNELPFLELGWSPDYFRNYEKLVVRKDNALQMYGDLNNLVNLCHEFFPKVYSKENVEAMSGKQEKTN